MLRKICSVFMALLVALFCLPVSSLAAESNLQQDFDDGLMTLTTSLAYYKNGSGYTNLRFFHSNTNGISDYESYDYVFSRFNNPNYKFTHTFEISYNDGRVLMPQGDSLTFSIHNFYSGFYWGEYDEENYDLSRYCWLDISKYTGFSMYFWDFEGNRYTVSKDMYEIKVNQDDAMITIQMNSDMYDVDVYRIRLFINFELNALYCPYSGVGWVDPVSWVDSYDSIFCSFGYDNLFFEISADDEATTGLLTSIIDYIKELPSKIRDSFVSLIDDLLSNISFFFDSLQNKLTSLFSVFTDEQPTYAPFEEGSSVSDYQNAEDEAMNAAGIGDLDANIDSAFENADSVFNNNNAYAFISASMEQIVFGNIKISGLVIFSLAMGLCVLVLGRKLNSA